jgi:phosphoribosylpyrophosphate synthetase
MVIMVRVVADLLEVVGISHIVTVENPQDDDVIQGQYG